MRIDIVTIFPACLDPLRQSLPGKAIESGLVDLNVHDLRRWTRCASLGGRRTLRRRPGNGDEGAGVG